MRWLLLGVDTELAIGLGLLLRAKGDELISCPDSKAHSAHGQTEFGAIVVQWPNAEGSDLAWLRQVRHRYAGTPLMVLTTAAHLAPLGRQLDRLDCTFILKPIATEILAAQLHDLVRGHEARGSGPRRCGDVDIDLRRRIAARRGNHVNLTTREWMLLDTLLQSTGRALPKNELAARVVFDSNAPCNAVEVHLSNIRRKLGRGLVETIRGRGYRIRE
jgi:two-component system OmpR family response regulator